MKQNLGIEIYLLKPYVYFCFEIYQIEDSKLLQTISLNISERYGNNQLLI